MNNLRLLTGLLAAALSGSGACVYSRTPVSLEEILDQLQKLVEVLKNYPSVNLFLGA